ncbi:MULTISPECIES: hypothetical protein [unclassified Psychrobacter]|uniref:hypothetical protein n=1 Tax=unclassified Psychrobacter TaxID=196806 RepID=UPI0008A67A75|nr:MULTISPECIES: hypothetical protein [unclassified Psychrobacter]AOY43469.1 hypothetical protein AOT82_1090 [Psychrobacter sp. AntiMn-1]BBI66806.1 hypothetical protein PKHYL_09970 [Psychrobacter sp. KH172YL61]|tara:strand:+ start:3484 stop:3813 length:330 start_codon:yes stop_codon:yes gene_type:complete
MSAEKETQSATTLCEFVKLPVGILVDGKRYHDIELTPITVGQSYAASMNARETDLQVLVDLATMTHVPALGRALTYDELDSASRQDGQRLEIARIALEKKEREQATKSA